MGGRAIARLLISIISAAESSAAMFGSQPSGRLPSVPLTTRILSLRRTLRIKGAPTLSHLLSSTEPPRMSCELNDRSTSPGRTPALAAGDGESTPVTIGYESKNALPPGSIIAWSEILTPNHPVGGPTITFVLCAWTSSGTARNATSAMNCDAFRGVCVIQRALTLEPPQTHRLRELLLRCHASAHRRQVVLVDNRIVRGRLQRDHGRILDLVERCGTCRVHRNAVSHSRGAVANGKKLGRALIILHGLIECGRSLVHGGEAGIS